MRTDTGVAAQPLPAPPVAAPSVWPTLLPPLIYAFAWIVIPYLGWIAGAVLIATSRRWSLRAKVLSILAPLVAAVVYVAGVTALSGASPTEMPLGPSISTLVGEVLVDTLYGSYFVVAGASFIAGIWLLALALRRSYHGMAAGISRV
jgi:hypothetical protein